MHAGGTVPAMTVPHASPPAAWPPPPPARRPARGGLIAAVLAGATVVAVLAAGGVWLAARPDPVPAAASSAPAVAAPLAVAGVVVLGRGQFAWYRSTNACTGQGAFGDIREGAQVTISDAGGKALAVAALGPGVGQGSSTVASTAGAVAAACELRFAVPAVPAGAGPYGLQFAQRGVLRFTEQEMTSLRVGF